MDWQERQQRFTGWAHRYDGVLWKVARSFAIGADQQDLHQELLLALWKALPAFRGESSESTFTYRVAYNHALMWIRKRRVREVPLDQSPPQIAAGDDAQWRIERLYEQIRKLPELDRALVLLYLDEISYREMAEVLGISESNVGVRLNRVKKQLAERMKEVARA